METNAENKVSPFHSKWHVFFKTNPPSISPSCPNFSRVYLDNPRYTKSLSKTESILAQKPHRSMGAPRPCDLVWPEAFIHKGKFEWFHSARKPSSIVKSWVSGAGWRACLKKWEKQTLQPSVWGKMVTVASGWSNTFKIKKPIPKQLPSDHCEVFHSPRAQDQQIQPVVKMMLG